MSIRDLKFYKICLPSFHFASRRWELAIVHTIKALSFSIKMCSYASTREDEPEKERNQWEYHHITCASDLCITFCICFLHVYSQLPWLSLCFHSWSQARCMTWLYFPALWLANIYQVLVLFWKKTCNLINWINTALRREIDVHLLHYTSNHSAS